MEKNPEKKWWKTMKNVKKIHKKRKKIHEKRKKYINYV